MFRTIIAGCDGFDRGREAAAFAAGLADATDAGLLLVAAVQEAPPRFPEPFREYAKQVDRAIRDVRDEVARGARTVTVEALSPAHALRHTAERENADLIVVGARRRGRFARFAEADHALQVLHAAPHSVAVVPDETVLRPHLARIVAGLEDSPEGRAAVHAAAGLARATGAELWVLVVVDDRRRASYVQPLDWSARLAERKAAGRALLERTLGALPEMVVEGAVATGNPAQELADCGTWADLLVVGSRRWGPVKRLTLGSTGEAVVRHCAGPVLVVPRTSHQPQPRRAGSTAGVAAA